MRLSEIFHIVTINMIENKFRLLLTTLGIIVGTITIILVIAIGKGGEQEAAKQFSNLSADTIYVNLDYTALGTGKDITTVEKLTPELMERLGSFCDEFLVHAVDVEGKARGVETELAKLLGQYTAHPVTYAGGVGSMADIEELRKAGQGRLDVTVGSALDIFGGSIPFEALVKMK